MITIDELKIEIRKADKDNSKVLDWLKLERIIRQIYDLRAQGTITDYQSLIYISDILGAVTGRGYPLE